MEAACPALKHHIIANLCPRGMMFVDGDNQHEQGLDRNKSVFRSGPYCGRRIECYRQNGGRKNIMSVNNNVQSASRKCRPLASWDNNNNRYYCRLNLNSNTSRVCDSQLTAQQTHTTQNSICILFHRLGHSSVIGWNRGVVLAVEEKRLISFSIALLLGPIISTPTHQYQKSKVLAGCRLLESNMVFKFRSVYK